MLPINFQYALPAGNASTLGTATASGSVGLSFATTVLPGTVQRRIVVASNGNDSGIYFFIKGLNQAGFTVSEFVAGSNGSTTPAQSVFDYASVITIAPSSSSTQLIATTTASTWVAGVNGVGSSLWNIVNTHVTPVNVQYATILQANAATWSIQYTYDDPNNLTAGVTSPQAFNHPSIVNATTSVDGSSNDPIFAWRLLVSAGTGTIRAIGTQAGIGGP